MCYSSTENGTESQPWFDLGCFGSIDHNGLNTVDPSLLCSNSKATRVAAAPETSCLESIFTSQCKTLETSAVELLHEIRRLSLNEVSTFNLLQAEHRIENEINSASIYAEHLKDLRHSTEVNTVGDSDVTDDEDATYGLIDKILRGFYRDSVRQFLVLPNLKLSHRRHAHALARCMGLIHFSLGGEENRLMIISKVKSLQSPTKLLKNELREIQHRHKASREPRRIFADPQISPPTSSEGRWSPRQLSPLRRSPWQNQTVATEFPLGHSTDTSVSSVSTNGSHKRRRQSRHEGAFICFHDGCEEVFDRQCDLTQHERSHLPHDQRPYGCEICNKRFLFPKDLRRHEKTHGLS